MATVARALHPWLSVEPYRVTVEEYSRYRRDGYLIVRGLVLPEHVAELRAHTEGILSGEIDVDGWVHQAPGRPLSPSEKVHRIHQGHTKIELWERYLLYPRVLDVVEALIGPDVMAMQTMLFTKGPGSNGQGFHQDAYYIPVFPDTLIGAWIAIDPADEENGCLRMSPGSNVEPIYPPKVVGSGHGDVKLKDIPWVQNVGGHSNDDEDPLNTLKPIAEKYKDVETPAVMRPGDVAFFGGHTLHRSLKNRSTDRYRRSFVNHYANARSFTIWGGGQKDMLLARGNTHLEFRGSTFGTPCAGDDPERSSISDNVTAPEMMMATPGGAIEPRPAPNEEHDH